VGVRYTNLHERIPNYHVRVVVPQLLGASSAAVNASMRGFADAITARFRVKAIRELRSVATDSKGRIPAGRWAIEPQSFLIASSPEVFDTLLPVSMNYPNGLNSQWWEPAAFLESSGKRVDIYTSLFARPGQAHVVIARYLRRTMQTHSPFGPPCAQPGPALRQYQLPNTREVLSALSTSRAFDLVARGLAVGINQGDLAADACGNATFLVPFRVIEPLLNGFGGQLVAGFQAPPSGLRGLLGVSALFAIANPSPGRWIAAGVRCLGSCSTSFASDVVVGAISQVNGRWTVTNAPAEGTSAYGDQNPCAVGDARGLVPGGSAIALDCYNGGSDGEHFVLVYGFAPISEKPTVFLSADCGQTSFVLRGSYLVLRSWGLRAGPEPVPENPTLVYRWTSNGLRGYSAHTGVPIASHQGNLPGFCTSAGEYFGDH
jgi:hypothetical protein